MEIPIHRTSPDVPFPNYQTPGACAFDLAVIEPATIQPNERVFLRTGLVIKVPHDHVLLLMPRSSNAKKGIRLGNGVGVIDSDYCGVNDEIKLALHNVGNEPYSVQTGERLAQGLFIPITRAIFQETDHWEAPDRGGFGTTG